MKKIAILLLITFSLISCKKKPTFCKNPYEVNEIKLIPTKHWSVGREITIKNDSLIDFITQQICDVKDVNWSTGTRGEGERVEIQFSPNRIDEKIFVVHRGLGNNDYRFREGTAYFRNDLLCELIFKLTGIPYNEKKNPNLKDSDKFLMWENFKTNIENNEYEYLIENSTDSIKCIDCIIGKEEYKTPSEIIFKNYKEKLYNSDLLNKRQYSIYENDSIIRISYNFKKMIGNESSEIIYMFDKVDDGFLFTGMITAP